MRAALDAMLLRFPKPAGSRSPVLVIAAERDAIFTLDEQRALAAAYNAALLVIPGATHDLMLDPAWHQAANAIEEFVQRTTRDETRQT